VSVFVIALVLYRSGALRLDAQAEDSDLSASDAAAMELLRLVNAAVQQI